MVKDSPSASAMPLIYGDSSTAATGGSQFRLRRANIVYVIFFLVISVLSFVLYNTCPGWLVKVVNSSYDSESRRTDLAFSLVARTTSAAALFYFVHYLAMLCNPNLEDSCQFIVHVSWPGLHFVLFLVFYAIFLFLIPDGFFDAYVYFSYGASALYLILQIVFLIDVFYDINIRVIDNTCALTSMTGVLSALTLLGYALGFWRYHETTRAAIVLGVNLGGAVLIFAAAAFVERASIFTASMITAYTAFLTFSGCMCVDARGATDVVVSIIFGLLMLFWVGYSAFSTTKQFGSACTCADEERPFSLSFFHGIFALGCVYLTMLATNWARDEADEWSIGQGTVSMWINWASAWVSFAIYAWTIVAPLVLSDREF
jgi:hypothetical protein